MIKFLIKRAAQCTKLLPMRNPREVSDNIGSIVCSITLHYKRLFPQLESVTTRSHDGNFIVALRLPQSKKYCKYIGDMVLNDKVSYVSGKKCCNYSVFYIHVQMKEMDFADFYQIFSVLFIPLLRMRHYFPDTPMEEDCGSRGTVQ